MEEIIMENKLQLKKNVNRNYIFTLLQSIDFTRGIWMIYLAGKGLSLTQLGLLETIFHIASFTMEVPTGVVADVFGRRISRIWGRIMSLVSVIILLLSNSFWMFALSFVLTAISYNLESGAGDALIYDSLKEIGEEDRFMKVNGNKELFYQAASAISFLIGGILAVRSYNIAFTLTIVFGVITIVQSFTFREPSIGAIEVSEGHYNVFIKQIKDSLKAIADKPKVGALIIFTQSILAFCTSIFFYLQNFLKAGGYNEDSIGLIYAVSSVVAAIVSTQVFRIERKIKEQGILVLIPMITIACIWGIAYSRYHYLLFIVMMVTESVIFVAVSDYINKMIPSENRATILSFASMVFSFFMITLFPAIGVIADRTSLSFAFVCLGAVGSLIVLANGYFVLTKLKKQP
jgi:MFS family permease